MQNNIADRGSIDIYNGSYGPGRPHYNLENELYRDSRSACIVRGGSVVHISNSGKADTLLVQKFIDQLGNNRLDSVTMHSGEVEVHCDYMGNRPHSKYSLIINGCMVGDFMGMDDIYRVLSDYSINGWPSKRWQKVKQWALGLVDSLADKAFPIQTWHKYKGEI